MHNIQFNNAVVIHKPTLEKNAVLAGGTQSHGAGGLWFASRRQPYCTAPMRLNSIQQRKREKSRTAVNNRWHMETEFADIGVQFIWHWSPQSRSINQWHLSIHVNNQDCLVFFVFVPLHPRLYHSSKCFHLHSEKARPNRGQVLDLSNLILDIVCCWLSKKYKMEVGHARTVPGWTIYTELVRSNTEHSQEEPYIDRDIDFTQITPWAWWTRHCVHHTSYWWPVRGALLLEIEGSRHSLYHVIYFQDEREESCTYREHRWESPTSNRLIPVWMAAFKAIQLLDKEGTLDTWAPITWTTWLSSLSKHHIL